MQRVLVLLAILAYLCIVVQAKTITIACSFAIDKNDTSTTSLLEKEVVNGMKFYFEHVSKGQILIGNETYHLNLTVLNSGSNTSKRREHYEDLCRNSMLTNDNHYFFITSPVTFLAQQSIKGLEKYGCVSINAGSEDDGIWKKGDKPRDTIPLGLSPKRAFSSMLPYVRIRSLKTAIIVCAGIDITTKCKFLKEDLPDFGATVLDFYNVMSSGFGDMTPHPDVTANWTATADKIVKYSDLDLLVIGSRGFLAEYITQQLNKHGWMPKLIVRASLDGFYGREESSFYNFNSLDTLNLQTGINRFVPSSNYSADEFGFTLDSFTKAYEEQFNKPMRGSLSITGFYSCAFWIKGLMDAKSVEQRKVRDTILSSEYQTFIGPHSWDRDHSSRWLPFFVQIQRPVGSKARLGRDVIKVLAPLSAASNSELVYPAPQPYERSMQIEFGHGSEILITTLTCLAVLLTIIFSVFVIIFRNNKIVKGSSLCFVLLVAFGAILLLSTNFTWAPSMWSTFLCHFAFYTFNIGFSIMFGSLFAKSLRIVIIMQRAKKLKVIVVSDAKVFVLVTALVTIDVVILVLFSMIANPKSKTVHPDPYKLDISYITCVPERQAAYTAFIWVMAGYKCVLMLIGMYTGWKVHYIPYKHLNESKVIAFSLYNVIFFAAIGYGFSYALRDEANENIRYGLYALRSLTVFLAAGLTILALFFQKIFLIKGLLIDSTSFGGSNDEIPPSVEVNLRGSNMASDTSKEEYEKLLEKKNAKIRNLRRKLRSLKSEMSDSKMLVTETETENDD